MLLSVEETAKIINDAKKNGQRIIIVAIYSILDM